MNHSAILHIDGDDFFATAARLKDPTLRNRPLIVGHLQSRGAVIANSYETRSSGIHPGLTMAQAKRLCPDAAMVQIDWDFIQRLSSALYMLVSRYSPLVESVGSDAFFLDYSGCHRLFGQATDFASRLREEISDRIRINVSVGLATDKAVSAVACRAAKMGKLESVASGREQDFLNSCPLQWLPGIDTHRSDYFAELGVRTIGELSRIPIEIMEHIMGSEGRILARRARGIEGSRVHPMQHSDMPAARAEFREDIIDPDKILTRLAILASDLGECLRRRRQASRYLVLRIGYSDFRIARLQMALTPPSNRDPEIFRCAREAFIRLYQRRVRIREVSIHAHHLTGHAAELPFGAAERRNRWDRTLTAVDRIRRKHHPGAMQLGAALSTEQLFS
ncbi:hypothetical protein JW823_04920 [bacterium]|nr:hypothetical protein [candidate division CSSED10-310 bacterium]